MSNVWLLTRLPRRTFCDNQLRCSFPAKIYVSLIGFGCERRLSGFSNGQQTGPAKQLVGHVCSPNLRNKKQVSSIASFAIIRSLFLLFCVRISHFSSVYFHLSSPISTLLSETCNSPSARRLKGLIHSLLLRIPTHRKTPIRKFFIANYQSNGTRNGLQSSPLCRPIGRLMYGKKPSIKAFLSS